MRRTRPLEACVVASLAAAGLFAGAAAQQPDPVADLFARGRALQQTMHSVRASFVETTVSTLVVDPIVARGTVVAAVKPLRVVLRYSSPSARTVWLDDQELVVAWAGKPRVETLRIADVQRRVQKYFAGATLDELRSSFDLALAREAGPPPRLRLDMTPKRRQIKEGLLRLQLWLDPDRLLMSSMRMEFPAGDRQTFTFSDIEINPTLPEDAFARPRGGGQ